MLTLKEALSKKQVPYDKTSLRVSIVDLNPVLDYTNDQGQQKKSLKLAVADSSHGTTATSYDQTNFQRLKLNTSVLLRNYIVRNNNIIITSMTKVFPSKDIPTTEITRNQALQALRPPPAEMKPLRDALSSPPKQRISVRGKIVQEDAPKQVPVKDKLVSIKTIYLQDATHPKCQVTLWREAAFIDISPGDHVQITNVVTNQFNKEINLSTTYLTKIEKCKPQEEVVTLRIEAVMEEDTTMTLLLQDTNEPLEVPMDVMIASFPHIDDIENHINMLCSPSINMTATKVGDRWISFTIDNE